MQLSVRYNGAYCVPDSSECITVALGDYAKSIYWLTVRDLMLAGF